MTKLAGDLEETFVLIVGGGPVGLTAAIDLAQRNVPAILVTQNLKTATQPRCNFVNARSMEQYRRLGLAKEIRAAAPLRKTYARVAFATRYCGHELGSIDLEKMREDPVRGIDLLGPEPGLNISQLFLEPLLRKRAESSTSVDVRFGWRLKSFESSEDCGLATVEDVRSLEERKIRARYVIAADGARSSIRKHFDIGMTGTDGRIGEAFVSGTMLTYFFKAPSLIAESGRAPALVTWIINHELRSFMFMHDRGEHWVMHYNVPDGVRWEDVRSNEIIPAVLGKDVPYEIIAEGPWTGGLSLVADKFQAGRAFLAGDAAHLFTPLGGFGMNTGVGDALNLTWKLAAVHAGWAGQALLDSYEKERRPIGFRNSKIGIHCSLRKGKWVIPPDIEGDGEQASLARAKFGEFLAVDDMDEYETSGLQLGERYETSPIVCPNAGASSADTWANYRPSELIGGRAPHFWISEDSALYDVLGPGFTLIDFDSGLSLDPIHSAAIRRGVPLSIVNCGPLRESYCSKLLLVRPDQHIAWGGNGVPADPLALFDRVRGASHAE